MAEIGLAPMLGIALLLSILSLQGLQSGIGSTDAQDSSLHTKSKLSKFAAPTLKFMYW